MNECPHCGRSDKNLIDAINDESCHNDNNQVNAVGFKEVMERITKEWHGEFERDSTFKGIKDFMICPKYMGANFELADIRISHHNLFLKEELEAQKKSGNIIVLYPNGD